MLFARIVVEYVKDHIRTDFFLCSDKEDCGTTNNGIEIIYFKTPIAMEAMKAHEEQQRSFYCNDVFVILVKYMPFKGEPKYNPFAYEEPKKINFIVLEKPQPIFIYRKACHCESCKRKFGFNDIEYRIARVSSMTGQIVEVDVEYCKTCGSYFIDYESLKMYEEKYGVLIFERKKQSNRDEFGNIVFADDTVLSRYGYSAGANCPPDVQRHAILRFLINSNIATKGELKEILSGFLTY